MQEYVKHNNYNNTCFGPFLFFLLGVRNIDKNHYFLGLGSWDNILLSVFLCWPCTLPGLGLLWTAPEAFHIVTIWFVDSILIQVFLWMGYWIIHTLLTNKADSFSNETPQCVALCEQRFCSRFVWNYFCCHSNCILIHYSRRFFFTTVTNVDILDIDCMIKQILILKIQFEKQIRYMCSVNKVLEHFLNNCMHSSAKYITVGVLNDQMRKACSPF